MAIAATLGLVALLTAGLATISRFLDVHTVTMIYLIPVMFAAITWGILPALVASIAGIGMAAFFFYPPLYPPLYDLRVYRTDHVVDLMLFIFVAVITGHLASRARQAKIRAEAETLREALIDSVSHELRTPLSTLLGSVSVVSQSEAVRGDVRLASLLSAMQESAERLDTEIGNLLEATRITGHDIDPRSEWIDPGDIISAALDHKRRVLGPRPIKVDIEDGLPLLRGDAVLLERAFLQLIDNAAKYAPPDTPIEIHARQRDGFVELAVRDHGVGLTADELPRIWDRFYRGARHQRTVPGAGLGLWIAKALVVACGGQVAARSEGEGKGTTLILSLPKSPTVARVDIGDE